MQLFKKTVSVLVLSSLLLCFMSGFAFSASKTIVWEEFEEELTYAGELIVGENTFTENGAFAFGFTAEQAGIYAISFSVDDAGEEYEYAMFLSGSYVDGEPSGCKDGIITEEYGSVYYFEEGETQLYGLKTAGDIRAYSVSIQYLGDMKNYELVSNDLQADFDIGLCEYEGETLCEIYAPVCVATSTDNTFSVDYLSFPFSGEKLVSGSYSVSATLLGLKKTIEFNVYNASDYVSDIKPASGYTSPVVFFTEDGEYDYYDYDENAFAVNYVLTDGTEKANETEYTDFSFFADDGHKVRFFSDVIQGEDGKYYWTVHADDFSVILSEAQISGYEPVPPDDDQPDEKESFLKTLFLKIRMFINRIVSFFTDIWSIRFSH